MNLSTPDLFALIAFALIAVACFVLGQMLVGRGRNAADAGRRQSLVFGPLTHVLAYLLPIQFESTESLDKDILRAGYYGRHARVEYLAMRNVLVLGWIGVTVAMMFIVEDNWTTQVLIGGLLGTALLLSFPRLLLQSQASGRLRRIQHSLPDALDMLSMTMVGGMPMQRALQHVSHEIEPTYPDLACEFTIIRRHTEAGSLDQALRHFARRIDIPDVQSLASIVSQTDRLGSNVVQAFQDYSDDIRRSQRQQSEARANRTSVAMIAPIVLCLAPPIYILLLGPAMMQLRSFVVKENRSGGLLRPDISNIDNSGALNPTSPAAGE